MAMRATLSLTLVLAVLPLTGGLDARPHARARTVTAQTAVKPRTDPSSTVPEIVTDLSRLPARVARMRTQILEAARSGDLDKVLTVMQSNETMPIFSYGNEKDPVAYWKANYPDSQGLEILAILISILETGFVHADINTAQDMYIWPYFARVPLTTLTPAQKVELFRIATGADYKDMQDTGQYSFYRVGIGPDGTWHFFVAGK